MTETTWFEITDGRDRYLQTSNIKAEVEHIQIQLATNALIPAAISGVVSADIA